jgi:hypothetical protein
MPFTLDADLWVKFEIKISFPYEDICRASLAQSV